MSLIEYTEIIKKQNYYISFLEIGNMEIGW